MPWPFGRTKASEQRRRAVQSYIAAAATEPDDTDVEWLASISGDRDADRARWELRYMRRAIWLLVSEREALDDRTGSEVAREMRLALQMDRGVAAGMVAVAERQFNQRLAAFRAVFTDRTLPDSADRRLARVLLERVGARDLAAATERAGSVAKKYLEDSIRELKSAFGVAAVPEDVPPSLWAPKGRV